MNLAQSVTMSQLALPRPMPEKEQILSARKVALMILARCEKGGYPYEHFPVNNHGAKLWAKKFLTSKEFVLKRVNLNAAASPHNPRDPKRVKIYTKQILANAQVVRTYDPIVIDMNKHKAGRTLLGYIPDVIVVDGKHRKKAMLACGITSHLAWVGLKAQKKLKAKDMHAASDSDSSTEIYLPPVDGTKIMSQYEMKCATVPAVNIPVTRQDTGSGGSRPKDMFHPEMEAKKKLKANQMCGCGAISTGSLDKPSASDTKVPPDQSDAGSNVEASDQRKFNPNKPQIYPGGLKPGNVQQFGLSKQAAYQNNTGPRVINRGASRSEMSRELEAGGPGSGRRPSGKMTKEDIRLERKANKSRSRMARLMKDKTFGPTMSKFWKGHEEEMNAAKTIPKIWTKKKKLTAEEGDGGMRLEAKRKGGK